jgi:hypothetical protein
VTVKNADGTVVGTGNLSSGRSDGAGTCNFTFSVPDVRKKAAATASRVMSSGVNPRPPQTNSRSARSPAMRSTRTIRSLRSGTATTRRGHTPRAISSSDSQDAFSLEHVPGSVELRWRPVIVRLR